MTTVTDEYKAQLQQYHAGNPAWGTGCGNYFEEVRGNLYGGKVILDYGCGKGTLKKAMKVYPDIEVVDYDPGIPGKDSIPDREYDLVACRDVLEHIEPECIDEVLADIQKHAGRSIWLMIHTKPAGAILPDGRNAHLIQEGMKWWKQKLEPLFPGCKIEENMPWLRVTWQR